jgi:hypothetical protein
LITYDNVNDGDNDSDNNDKMEMINKDTMTTMIMSLEGGVNYEVPRQKRVTLVT